MYKFQNHANSIAESIIKQISNEDNKTNLTINFAVLVSSQDGPVSVTQELADHIVLHKDIHDQYEIKIGEAEPFCQDSSDGKKIFTYTVICLRKSISDSIKNQIPILS